MNIKKVMKFSNNEGDVVGQISFIEHFDYIYCEMVEVFSDFRQKGWGKFIIDTVREKYNKPLRYSVVSDKCIGAKFWNNYTKDKEVTHLFGHTYEIKEATK